MEIPAGSVLKSALAGGLSCALSCSLLHPVDTIKVTVSLSLLIGHGVGLVLHIFIKGTPPH